MNKLRQPAAGGGDTPETDAILEIASIEDRYLPMLDLCRKLERQSNEEISLLAVSQLKLGEAERRIHQLEVKNDSIFSAYSELRNMAKTENDAVVARINELEQDCRRMRKELAER